jgi:3-hydroxyacyl-CoA dehydrogenase/enoyl-CoA hydratase/3-hydroxybutyryl-CoA epimerase
MSALTHPASAAAKTADSSESSDGESVSLCLRDDGIAIVRFDRPGSSANILDSATLHALGGLLEKARQQPLRGLVIETAKPTVFIAGADLKELAGTQRRSELVDLGQQTFSSVAALRCVTVAAIHGACAGGGTELALACDYRVASDDKSTRIGLPEVNLGLIPAWGGSTRLPRLVGLRRALKAILSGDLMPARKAREIGLVDALAPQARLLDLATRFVGEGKRRWRGLRHVPWAPAFQAVSALARNSVLRKTHGHYPAAFGAIDVVAKSTIRSVPRSLAAEKEMILALANTAVSRNLIRVFFLQDRAKRRPTPKAHTVTKTAVIGSGVMGSGIAQWLAARGLNVLVRDLDANQLAQGLKRIHGLFADARRRGLLSAPEAQAGMDRVVPVEIAVDLGRVELAIEAAVEKMEPKKRIFADLEARTSSEAVLATNTSALSIAEIGRDLRHPERVLGLHFFNPVHRMKLVEVVQAEKTSETALDTAVGFVQRIGKVPVVVRDRPGFLVNRILLPYLLEAVRLFDQGAPATAIDESMVDFGMPMGPLRLMDEIGLDVGADVALTLCAAFPDRMRTPKILRRLLEAKIVGRKGMAGFYVYGGGRRPVPNPEVSKLRERQEMPGISQKELQQRMVLAMINEAAMCLEERIVDDPRDVDFAMIMGTGFAPFRGGPLRYADAMGIAAIAQDLRRLDEAGEHQFAPSASLVEMGRRGKTFYEGHD